jgi:predicted ribosome quality control (RQC) complex YloA/Tae2 family protein
MKNYNNNNNIIIINIMKIFKYNLNDKEITLRLGENAKENHQLIDVADPNDWWFHLKDYPSGHCILELEELDNEIIIYASQIVKEHSKYKNNKKTEVNYLQIKNIKKTKNPGEVKLLKNANVIVLK